jgi:hypothetical protein
MPSCGRCHDTSRSTLLPLQSLTSVYSRVCRFPALELGQIPREVRTPWGILSGLDIGLSGFGLCVTLCLEFGFQLGLCLELGFEFSLGLGNDDVDHEAQSIGEIACR